MLSGANFVTQSTSVNLTMCQCYDDEIDDASADDCGGGVTRSIVTNESTS